MANNSRSRGAIDDDTDIYIYCSIDDDTVHKNTDRKKVSHGAY